MKNSAINWTDHTFNPWEGCTKFSPGCVNCYAETNNKRGLRGPVRNWGKGAPRRMQSEAYWKEPLAWNKQAALAGVRYRVFCASTADWADAEAPEGQREKLFELIKQTPNLDWLLLTKRAENIKKCLPEDWGQGYANVWLGVSVENKINGLPRIDVLRNIPAVCHFLSCEPLIEDLGKVNLDGIQWVIIGGETGKGPSKKDTKKPGMKPVVGIRSMDVRWVDSLIKQCREQGVAPWFKQLGKLPLDLKGQPLVIMDESKDGKVRRSPNGENWDQWPQSIAHLRIREIPDFSQAERDKMETSLSDLAKELDEEQASKELKLRAELLAVEGRLFLTREEKARIVKAYYDIYQPKSLWSAFCRAINMPRRTAYDFIEVERRAEAGCTKSLQLTAKKEKPLRTPQNVAEKAKQSVVRLLKGLTTTEKSEAMKLIGELLEAERKALDEEGKKVPVLIMEDKAPMVTITPAA